MSPRRLRLLLIGLALFFIGPVLGYIVTLAIMMSLGVQGMAGQSLAEALAGLQRLPGQVLAACIPAALGFLAGGVGIFLVVANLVIHFLGQENSAPPALPVSPKPAPVPRPLRPAEHPDARYMPSPR